MRIFPAVFAVLISATATNAIERFNSTRYDCETLQNIIRDQGAAILRYPSQRKPDLILFDRYVRNDSFCAAHQITERVSIPAADTDHCPVRHCISIEGCGDDEFCRLR